MYSMKDETKKQMKEEITAFFLEEHDLNLGIIATDTIYDFFTEELGTYIYNQGLDDAKRFMQKQMEDMDSDYYALYKD